MPNPETPIEESRQPDAPQPEAVAPEAEERITITVGPAASRSRWVDYQTHELLEMISELEDEKRWSRLREGIWLAILLHILLLSAATWIPQYVFKAPRVIDPIDAIRQRKDLTYLDMPPDALKQIQPKVVIKPVPQKPLIDQKTMEEMKKVTPPTPQPEAPPPPQTQPQAQPQTPAPIPPQPQTQSQVEAPRPTAVPARPSFAMGKLTQNDQLREAMKDMAHGAGTNGGPQGNGLAHHPGSGAGGVDVLSDTQGVDFSAWLHSWRIETERTWDPLIPDDEVNPPISRRGIVAVRFKVLPNGRVAEMTLEGRSGSTAMDRAAWGAISGSNYRPLPHDFHGPYLELRAYFLYNVPPE